VRERLVDLAAKRGLPIVPHCHVGVAHSALAPESADDLLREADADMHRRRSAPA
jgi:hypothetical protein